MKYFQALFVIIIFVLIYLYEWPKISKEDKKLKVSFAALTLIGMSLSIMLVFFPDIAGPTDLLLKISDYIFGHEN